MFLGNLASEWAQLMTGVSAPVENVMNYTTPVNIGTAISKSTQISRQSIGFSPAHTKGVLGPWRGSPIHLLNSSMELHLVNQNLGEVYECMMSGITTRYLDYNCNLYAGSYRYSFDADCAEIRPSKQVTDHALARTRTPTWKRSSSGARTVTSQNPGYTLEDLASQINKVTMIGIARFLDNFGSLYGNVLEPKRRKQDERTLTATLQAFSLQFAPAPQKEIQKFAVRRAFDSVPDMQTADLNAGGGYSKSPHVFAAAWFNAYELLVASMETRSFIHLYAVFLFQMTTVPPEAMSGRRLNVSPLDIADLALYQMQELHGLIDDYCANLEPRSIYRFLLHSSLRIFNWYAYLRDTIASMLHPRACILEDAPLKLKGKHGKEPRTEQVAAFDQEVAATCQNAAGDLFHVFRQVIHLRQSTTKTSTPLDVCNLRSLVQQSSKLVDEYTSAYGTWLEHCTISFYRLSEKSKLSCGFLLLFWNLSVFCFVEHLHAAADILPLEERPPILDNARKLQKSAVRSVLATAQRIVNVSATGEFKLLNSIQLQLQFICHHANTSLVVLALTKAIEHTIDLNLNDSAEDRERFEPATFDDDPTSWMGSMKPLLTCLVNLETTVSGLHTARPALNDLMRHYGDILMDCWSHNPEDCL
ncbi:hypothetical protein LTR10_011609 [Elasticomyces elasticus]|uniref:Transcription factor domain-containing protein n=1 Tax=Exophiala sideris TaxID=1016849 RepID=A0ABR0JF01_9EURO|nr:hypothetical protein LTR10_011609 [Elasticomyces elasticus]KAK5061804.1 hypothetical protein LTR69_004987 [Exophiala sideris]KAK5184504.1 hypothetical protein LTR44_003178 [Eurotiomycetes sp. CCFEE 6388]